MMRAFVLFLCLLLGQSVAAAEIIVRAGEHDGFTRVVLSMPRGGTANVSGTKPIRVTVGSNSNHFNLSEASARLNTGRITGFRQTKASELEIETRCDCSVESYEADGNLLVIDVRGTVETMRTAATGVTQEFRLPLVPEVSHDSTANRRDVFKTFDQIKLPKPRGERRGQIQQQLARAISKGIGAGLLNTHVANADLRRSHGKDNSPVHALQMPNSGSHIRVMSAADARPEGAHTDKNAGKRCRSDHILTFADAPEEAQIFVEVASLRRQLFREFDQLDEQQAIRLAKLYIASGLGTEALEILSLIGLADTTLSVLAHIVEGEIESTAVPEGWSTNCENAIALWSYLIDPDLIERAPLNEDALLSGFNAFPRVLKQQLGPQLVAKLLEDGFQETAEEVLRFMRRGRKSISGEETVVHAQLLKEKGMYTEGIEVLNPVLKTNSEDAVSATIEFVELKIEQDHVVPVETVELLEAFYAENRNSGQSYLILATLAKANAKNEHFNKSFEALKSLAEGNADELMEESVGYVFERLSIDANNGDFLKAAFDKSVFATSLKRREKLMMVERLLDLGFAQRALDYLNINPRPDWMERERLFAARGHLALGRTALALEALSNLDGPEAIALRNTIENRIHNSIVRDDMISNVSNNQIASSEPVPLPNGAALSLASVTAKLEKSMQLRQRISAAVGQPVSFSE